MQTIALLCFGLLAWVLMGRKLVALATLLTFMPFVTVVAAGDDGGASEMLAGMTGIKGIMRFGGGLLFALLATMNRATMKELFKGPSLLALAFFAWSLIGLINSANLTLSIVRLMEWLVFFVGALVIQDRVTRRGGPIALLKFMLLAISPLLALLLFSALLDPSLAFETRTVDALSRLGGRGMDPNSIGFLAGILALGSISHWRLQRHRNHQRLGLIPIISFCLAIYILTITRSRTALVALGVALTMLSFGSAQRSKIVRARIVLLVIAFLLLIAFYSGELFQWTLRGDDIQTLLSGTGRVDLWAGLLSVSFVEQPYIGHGYMMLGESGAYMDHGYPWTNAHNAFMFALISTGIVGLGLILSMVWVGLRSCLRLRLYYDQNRTQWIAHQGLGSCFILVLMDAMADYGMVGHPTAAMFIFHILFVYSYASVRTK